MANRTPAYVALGLGAVGLTVGTIAGAVAVSKHGKLADKCDGGCPEGSQREIDSYRSTGALSTVGFVVGGVGLATGAVLYLLAPSTPKAASTATRPSLTPFLGPTGVGAFGRF